MENIEYVEAEIYVPTLEDEHKIMIRKWWRLSEGFTTIEEDALLFE